MRTYALFILVVAVSVGTMRAQTLSLGQNRGEMPDRRDFGDDSSEYANDGDCDDTRFVGDRGGSAIENSDSHVRHDATDCRTRFNQGLIRWDTDSTQNAQTLRGQARGEMPDRRGDFGDDSGDFAHDGDCDDTRFVGDRGGSAIESSDNHVRHNATDCRTRFNQGLIRWDTDSTPTPTPNASGLGASRDSSGDFGDDSSEYANDGECDDTRFVGDRGFAASGNNNHIGRDATDCRDRFRAGLISWGTPSTPDASGLRVSTHANAQTCWDWEKMVLGDRYDDDDIFRCLRAGADPSAQDGDGWTPLHYAAHHTASPAVIVALLEAGADPNARGNDGMIPLHNAALNNTNQDVIAALLRAGADPTAEIDGGGTPIDAANHSGNSVIAAMLESAVGGTSSTPTPTPNASGQGLAGEGVGGIPPDEAISLTWQNSAGRWFACGPIQCTSVSSREETEEGVLDLVYNPPYGEPEQIIYVGTGTAERSDVLINVRIYRHGYTLNSYDNDRRRLLR